MQIRHNNLCTTSVNMYLLKCLCITLLFAALKADNFPNNADNESSPDSYREMLRLVEELKRYHEQEITYLKNEVLTQKDEIAALREKIADQDQRMLQIIRQSKEHYHENDERRQRSLKETPKNRIRSLNIGEAIGFTAGLTKRALHLGAHQNIVFDHVETNVGNGYNPHHGVFTAPVSGLYVFYTSVLADYNREVWCELVVNGVIKTSAYARGTDGRHNQGSQALVIQLQQGDDVSVQNLQVDDAIYGSGYMYSTFSGFLLQEVESNAIVG